MNSCSVSQTFAAFSLFIFPLQSLIKKIYPLNKAINTFVFVYQSAHNDSEGPLGLICSVLDDVVFSFFNLKLLLLQDTYFSAVHFNPHEQTEEDRGGHRKEHTGVPVLYKRIVMSKVTVIVRSKDTPEIPV